MKPVIREYLLSLRERGELDAILPDLLSELGYNVFSRPSRGTRQFGVDVAAIGPKGDGRVYLFSIKPGPLTRADWASEGEQALKPSLEEILDAYIPYHLPLEYRGKQIVICPCLGGEVHEAVAQQYNGYLDRKSTETISFSTWNGDRLAGYLDDGLLREGLLTKDMQSNLRKAIAMCDEPDASFSHFRRLVDALAESAMGKPDTKMLRAARQISISAWMLFVWGREQRNLESAYLATEYALLRVWDFARGLLAKTTKAAGKMGGVLSELVDLHLVVSTEFSEKVLPHASNRHALSAAVHTASPLDINLKLFDILGRIALHGLWLVWADRRSGELSGHPPTREYQYPIHGLAERLLELVAHNTALLTPIMDEQVIDLALGFLFLAAQGRMLGDLRAWLSELVTRADFAYSVKGGRYPCTLREYADLAEHPKVDREDYFEDVTAGSVLLPMLAFWTAALGDGRALEALARLAAEKLSHCTMQVWLPTEESEPLMWRGQDGHGAAFFDIPITRDGSDTIEYILRECGPDTPFHALSAVKQGFWPLVLVACRHYRLPVPPHFWAAALPWVVGLPKNGRAHATVPESGSVELVFTGTGASPEAIAAGFGRAAQPGADWDVFAASAPGGGPGASPEPMAKKRRRIGQSQGANAKESQIKRRRGKTQE